MVAKKKGMLIDFETRKGDKEMSAYERYLENKEILEIVKEREGNNDGKTFSIKDLEKIDKELRKDNK